MTHKIEPEGEYKLAHLKDEKPTAEHGRCQDCRWWCQGGPQEQGWNNPRVQRLQSEVIGECRVEVPQLGTAGADGQKKPLALWPVTFANDWCARFEPHKGRGGLAGKMKVDI